jgi:malonyl-CoA decarboxylase
MVLILLSRSRSPQHEMSRHVKAGDTDTVQLLREMDGVLHDLLSMWFGHGFLSLQRVTWDTSASFLEKITGGEAVHPMRHWLDLKRRLGPYRRCFGFTHGAMPGEPLIVVHVALMPNITASIGDITKAYKDGKWKLDLLSL